MRTRTRLSLLLGLLLAGTAAAPATATGVYGFADEHGRLVLRDAQGEPGWRLLFAYEEAGARTLPVPMRAVGVCERLRKAHEPLPGWHGDVARVALDTGLDPDLILAVIWAESRCNPNALSPKGARGLMQLMPATAKHYGVSDAFDPAQNIRAGARYLGDLLALFSGNLELALAAYNAGPRSIFEARMRIPAFRETRAYVPAVLARLDRLKKT